MMGHDIGDNTKRDYLAHLGYRYVRLNMVVGEDIK